ncbi:hypothetical protein D3C77_675240 [compost metagenome]
MPDSAKVTRPSAPIVTLAELYVPGVTPESFNNGISDVLAGLPRTPFNLIPPRASMVAAGTVVAPPP